MALHERPLARYPAWESEQKRQQRSVTTPRCGIRVNTLDAKPKDWNSALVALSWGAHCPAWEIEVAAMKFLTMPLHI